MKSRNTFKLSAVATISLVLSQVAFAQGVGNIGSLPTMFTTTNPPTGWTVTDPAGLPIPVSLDPSGPVWGKVFAGPNGGPFAQPALGPALPVVEQLVVGGTTPWTDWHEDVIGVDATGLPDPNWTWANPTLLVNGLPAPGLTSSISGGTLNFYFNPVAPGSIVTIRKDLIYNGIPGTVFIGTLAVHQYPTPEPAMMGLLALGGIAVLRRRRGSTVSSEVGAARLSREARGTNR